MLGFLLVPTDRLRASTPRTAAACCTAEAGQRCRRRTTRSRRSSRFGPRAEIEAALRAALVEGLGLKPKLAFGPVRVAVTGRRVSPPLFESMELLGRERTLGRLRCADAPLGSSGARRFGQRPRAASGYHSRRRRPARVDGLGVWGNWQPN